MTGRTRLPGGEPRRASQRRTRQVGTPATRITPQWRLGDRVRGRIRRGISTAISATAMPKWTIANRVYRMRIA